MNYYNEFEPKAAAALRQLIADKLIPEGDVDERSIIEVRPEDLRGYTQCHFFAGIGGWSYALQLAGWPADRPVWTGSCPCQPFSSAGRQRGMQDERHLWPVWFNLIRECSPSVIFGEQVASAISKGWLDGVYSDLEAEGYACGSAVLPACGVGAPHKRDRLWFVAYAQSQRGGGASGTGCEKIRRQEINNSLQLGGASCARSNVAHSSGVLPQGCENRSRQEQSWGSGTWIDCPDGKQRLIERCSAYGDVANFYQQGPQGRGLLSECSGQQPSGSDSVAGGAWDDFEWIRCADGKARRIPSAQSGICLLAYGVSERVGLLRAAGNAIVPQVAAAFIKGAMQ